MNRFERTKKYDMNWVKENSMGPNPLWLIEELSGRLDLKKGMKVLDMGCGKALTSIFLAKEYGVKVFANDLWISQTENQKRIVEAGVEELVYPIKAEAHALPYAEEFFDALVSVDAYHYFGTDEIYLPWYYSKLAKKGAQIAMVVPGLTREFDGTLPKGLEKHWEPAMYTWHSAAWWRYHWEKTGLVDIEYAGDIEEGKCLWLDSGCDQDLLKSDEEDYLTFIMLIARKK